MVKDQKLAMLAFLPYQVRLSGPIGVHQVNKDQECEVTDLTQKCRLRHKSRDTLKWD